MGIFRYVSHPQVKIDPSIAVDKWALSEFGRGRAKVLAGAVGLLDTRCILSSDETKALDTAHILGDILGNQPEVVAGTHENNRSATGFLPNVEFEEAANQFFAHPLKSYRGWETADAAQERIVSNIFLAIMKYGDTGDILCVGHGAVGTLLFCHLANLPISRKHDQPHGGGNLFAFDMQSDEIVHGWMSIEAFEGLTGDVN